MELKTQIFNESSSLDKVIHGIYNVYPLRLRTSKRKIDTDREHMDETLVPELCVQIKFPTVYWIKAIFLPSALHRLNRLMISEELRLRIVSEAQMGAEFYPLGLYFCHYLLLVGWIFSVKQQKIAELKVVLSLITILNYGYCIKFWFFFFLFFLFAFLSMFITILQKNV